MMQVREFGQWVADQISNGADRPEPQTLLAGYIDYVAGCVDRESRLRELKHLRAVTAAEIDQLEAERERGAQYHHVVVSNPTQLDVDAAFRRLEQQA